MRIQLFDGDTVTWSVSATMCSLILIVKHFSGWFRFTIGALYQYITWNRRPLITTAKEHFTIFETCNFSRFSSLYFRFSHSVNQLIFLISFWNFTKIILSLIASGGKRLNVVVFFSSPSSSLTTESEWCALTKCNTTFSQLRLLRQEDRRT